MVGYDTVIYEQKTVTGLDTMRIKAAKTDAVTERELAHRRLARVVAAESIVLLENDGVLPLTPCPLALYGAGAATTIKGGTGSGEVNERYSVSIEQGLRQAGFTITTDTWLREYEVLLAAKKAVAYKAMARKMVRLDSDSRINIMASDFQYPSGRSITADDIRASKARGACDTAFYVIARQAGECTDRSLDERGYCLSNTELEHLKTLTSAYAKVIVAINAGGPMDLGALEEIHGIGALLFFCQQGSEGGSALADILVGRATPSGCLGASWPRRYEDLPYAMEYSHLGSSSTDEKYREGIFVGYRYFDSFDIAPRYEFGYGSSYTDFTIEHLDTTVTGTKITVTAQVINTGARYSGKKCVQLYVSAPNGRPGREFQSLVAFAKTGVLLPGASERLQLRFELTDVAGYNEESASFILEAGEYLLRLGESSRKTKIIVALSLARTVTTEVCTPICKLKQSLDELKSPESIAADPPQDMLRLAIDPDAIVTEIHDYRIPEPALGLEARQVLDTLSVEDMRRIVVATGIMDTKPYNCVPGAAAYTTSHLVDRGIPNMALCDGPAGVRVQKTSVKLKNGRVKPVEAMMEFMNYMPWYLKKIILGNPAEGELLYQYATAFPVGTALAQTWNSALIEQVGEAMGEELSEFGGTFLLAPGMNIQRNPLCGRNYEYYSEDPLLTGKVAAAFTRGVQGIEGCFVTIKHYACNNREADRNHSDSVIGERALREIYLKGYRIAIEEANAKGVMTSYNKINGVYTPNSYDLCTTVLRCEWGFDGLVMTDWFSTGKGLAGVGAALHAGNDLICPGRSKDFKTLEKDSAAGVFSFEDIKRSAARILQAAIRSGGYPISGS